jgi:hypothetical protein
MQRGEYYLSKIKFCLMEAQGGVLPLGIFFSKNAKGGVLPFFKIKGSFGRLID